MLESESPLTEDVVLAPLVAVPDPAGDEPRVRPGVLRFLWYCIGGSLPPQHSTWVLHDVTCSTWLLRHFARTLLIIAPLFTAYMVLMPASLAIRLLTGVTFAGGILVFSLVNCLVDTDRRAVRAGYLVGLPAQMRTHQSVERQRAASWQRRERIAARRERRNAGR